jgi:hypothetical protein
MVLEFIPLEPQSDEQPQQPEQQPDSQERGQQPDEKPGQQPGEPPELDLKRGRGRPPGSKNKTKEPAKPLDPAPPPLPVPPAASTASSSSDPLPPAKKAKVTKKVVITEAPAEEPAPVEPEPPVEPEEEWQVVKKRKRKPAKPPAVVESVKIPAIQARPRPEDVLKQMNLDAKQRVTDSFAARQQRWTTHLNDRYK